MDVLNGIIALSVMVLSLVVANRTLKTYNQINMEPGELQPKIVNGREAMDGEFPWMVALHFRGEYFCSAFLLSPTLVMTAAHCVELDNGIESVSEFFGMVGNVRWAGPGTKVEFREVKTHPDYGKTEGGEGDIALFRTAKPVPLSNLVRPICLPRSGRDFESGEARAMGWGWTSTNVGEPPEVMRTISLQMQLRALCRFFFAFFMVSITERHLCASAPTGPGGVCFGDSGGPLVYKDGTTGQPVSIGVAAFITTFGCGPPFLPNVYTSTAKYEEWIRDTAGQDADGICFV